MDQSSTNKPIYVAQPSLPELDDFVVHLRSIWESKTLTNGGPMHQRLELALCEHLRVPYVSLFTNATIALITALQALELKGEVITTPYSFVATANSLAWRNLTPVFVDIDPQTLNLDPSKLEAAITEHTSGILPVHCYGIPCDVAAIEEIAARRGLKVLYDAAHAFDVHCHCGSVLTHGDLSVLSFHATKVFNTFEGGAIISHSAEMKRRIDQLKNFGIINETTVVTAGLNGKMSEVCAAFGLLQLESIEEQISLRAQVDARYRARLSKIAGVRLLPMHDQTKTNHGYFPILVDPSLAGCTRDDIYDALAKENIFARKYFYPLISEFPMYQHLPSAAPENLPVARAAAEQVLCLPIYAQLAQSDQDRILSIIERECGV
jgi:dTDP-4-amino-4,6-dideoxygalactose transaminase